ncbi:MAG: hypothetical protein AB1898_08110 [Acidobacteriota bacterium]
MNHDEFSRREIKEYLDQNGLFLTASQLPRDVRCFFCKSAGRSVNLYLNHNSIGEALILCDRCHAFYQNSNLKRAAGR